MLQHHPISLSARFALLGAFIFIVIVMLAALLMSQVWDRRQAARLAVAGTPSATLLLDLLGDVQRHRYLSSRQLANDAAAAEPRAQLQSQVVTRLQQIRQDIQVLPVDVPLSEGLAQFEQDFTKLAQEVVQQRLGPRESFDRHIVLVRQLDDLMGRILTISGLVLESDVANHFFVMAGFQEGKTVLEQLTQLSDLGTAVLLNKGATPLDLNQIAAIRAKLEDRDRSVGQTLMLAQDYGGRALDPALAEALTLGGQEIRAVIELTDLTFLGMSPDWDVPHEKYQARMLQATEAQRALTRKIAETVVQALRQRSDSLTTFLLLVFAGSLLMLLVGGVLMVRSIRSIVRPLQSSLVQAQKLAEGDLSHSFASQEQNEVGRMLGALETARIRLNGLLAEVQTASSKVALASDEIRHGNQDLSGRTERTAQQLQNTSQFMRQLEADVKSAASASQEASVLSAQASEVAQRGGRAMADVMATMDSISNSSTRIRDIIGVIDGIAFQTNILALNAAVEAARAGEQGRGFAVVAAEVRMLAQRSSSAAQEIRGLIQDSVRDVKRGVELVKSAGSTSTDTVTQVQRMRDVVAQITDSAVRQSEDLRHLVDAVSELDLMTQQNAAMVEESSAATHSMADQAALLQGLVQHFRLDAEGGAQQRLAIEPDSLQSSRLAITG